MYMQVDFMLKRWTEAGTESQQANYNKSSMEDGEGPPGREVRLGSLDGAAAREQCGGGGVYVLIATPQGRMYVRDSLG